MTQARKTQICLEATPYYHVISRCVRRAFLCGEDRFTGKSFEHRRQIIVDRIRELADVFAIEICAYAIMHNHTHLVVCVDQKQAQNWTAKEVVERWCKLFKGPFLFQSYLAGASLSAGEISALDLLVESKRADLTNISRFMASLNEFVARSANKEDNCTGRFWEGRFKSQALLDEKAILQCMAYVDLNPIRAGMAKTPETSDYTAIQERVLAELHEKPTFLKKFPNPNEPQELELPIAYRDYLELVDWTGRAVRDDKTGHIPNELLPILTRLNLNAETWTKEIQHFGKWYYRAVGPAHRLKELANRLGKSWLKTRKPIILTT